MEFYLWPALLCGIIVYLISRSLMARSRYRYLMKKFVGPKPIPILGNLLLFKGPREGLLRLFGQLREEYGNTFVTLHGDRPVLNICHPNEIEQILGVNNRHLRKGKAYEFMMPWLGTGLLTSSSQKWFTHRKLITPTFHFKVLEGFVEIFHESSQTLVRALQHHANGHFFNICPYISFCALDIICETAMGTKINAQENRSNPYVTATLRISELITLRQFTLWYYADFIFYNTAHGKEFLKNLKIVHDFSESVIQERKLNKKCSTADCQDTDLLGAKKRVAFLDLLLDSAENENVSLSDLEIREEVDTFMFEGHDTTAMALCWTLLLLGNNLDVQSAVRAEIRRVLGDGDDTSPTLRHLGELKLLERVIKEGLRMYPSVPIITRICDDKLNIGGCDIPRQTDIAIHIFNMQRNPSVYPDPLKFDPDRFLQEPVQKRHPYAFIPFSAGQRNCIGQKFAMNEQKMVLSSILRRYEVIARDRAEDVPVCLEIVSRPKNGEIFLKLIPISP